MADKKTGYLIWRHFSGTKQSLYTRCSILTCRKMYFDKDVLIIAIAFRQKHNFTVTAL